MVGKWHCGMDDGYVMKGVAPDADPWDAAVQRRIRDRYESGQKQVRARAGWDFSESLYFTNKEGLGLRAPCRCTTWSGWRKERCGSSGNPRRSRFFSTFR